MSPGQEINNSDAVVVGAVRTPIGRHGGMLSGVRPDDLAAHAIAACVSRVKIDPGDVDEVVFGCANGAGEDNRDVARMATLLAGLPHEVPGVTVNRLCASGLEAVLQASRMLRLGDASVVLAGGVESMSRAPLVMLKSERAFARGDAELADSTVGWRFVNPRLVERGATDSLGTTAENVAALHRVSRSDQDAWSLQSHRRAVSAQDGGRFAQEMIPVPLPSRRNAGSVERVAQADEGPRTDTSLDKLAALPALFAEGGSVTAGNASQISDGAACLALSTWGHARDHGLVPLGRVVASGAVGVDPAVMGVGPIPAVRLALQRAGLRIDDVGLFELNEAFASQVLACARELRIDEDRLNVNGGAIALGHPLGCSGARLVTSLLYELQRRDERYGVAALCVGVGQGLAVIVENLEAGR